VSVVLACSITDIVAIISAVATIITAVIAGRALYVANKQAELAKKQLEQAKSASSASAVADLYKMYFSEEMRSSIERLANLGRYWQSVASGNINSVYGYTHRSKADNHPEPYNFSSREGSVESWKDVVKNNYVDAISKDISLITYPWSEEDEKARRVVKSYFFMASKLKKVNLIADDAFKDLCQVDGVVVFFTVVEPMEAIKNADYEFEPFYEVMKVLDESFTAKYEAAYVAHSIKRRLLADSHDKVVLDMKAIARFPPGDKRLCVPTKEYINSLHNVNKNKGRLLAN